MAVSNKIKRRKEMKPMTNSTFKRQDETLYICNHCGKVIETKNIFLCQYDNNLVVMFCDKFECFKDHTTKSRNQRSPLPNDEVRIATGGWEDCYGIVTGFSKGLLVVAITKAPDGEPFIDAPDDMVYRESSLEIIN
jgi:hypothetical protein